MITLVSLLAHAARLAAGETTYSCKLDKRSDDALRSRVNVILTKRARR